MAVNSDKHWSSKNTKNSKQRKAIRRVFEAATRPLSILEVFKLAKQAVPRLGIATVYRTLKLMISHSKLQVRELPGLTPRYSLPHAGKPAVFICTSTARVFYLDDKLIKLSVQNLPSEFKVDSYEVIFYGTYQGPDTD